jgi:gas vesicle protein
MRDRDETPYIVVERSGNGGVGSFVIGALLGAGVALLLAPRSGEETQEDLRKRALKLKGQAEDRVREVQDQLEQRLEQARAELLDRVDQVREAVEAGRESAHEARVDLEERIERSKAAYRAGLEAARETAREEKDLEEA